MLAALGGARALVEYAQAQPVEEPSPACELLGAEALARIAKIDGEAARKALEDARSGGQAFVTSDDPRYPVRLLDLCDPPPVLYYRGTLEPLAGRVVAIVGSRAATSYGRSSACAMAADFSVFGASVVSGLARGIDAAAHRGALRGDKPTIAVIGSGLHALYPPYHRQLADDIVAHGGAIISEFPPAVAARPHQFPMRNRVVAALADATIVIEAGIKSGALITARLAADLGRPVFALPGDVGRTTSEGTNGLIKDGVALTTGAADVSAVLNWDASYEQEPSGQESSGLLLALAPGGSGVDEVSAKTGLSAAAVSAQLVILEMQGAVERQPGGLFSAVASARKG
jgi:DNA processing protein